MSGTSMDGLDIALVRFDEKNGKWSYDLQHCKTYSYPNNWLDKLANSKQLSGLELMMADKDLGVYFGERVIEFLREFRLDKNKIDFIASHGHTIFHQPDRRLTTQIGCGQSIAYTSGIPVINDFRTKNVLAGGQGAPLVPIGDLLLFPEYDACLNIGGFSNISIKTGGDIIAYDVCPGNLPLNIFAQRMGKEYDHGGNLASHGTVDDKLLKELNSLSFYRKDHPKSLGTEWLDEEFMPNMSNSIGDQDALRTISEHISQQLAETFNRYNVQNVLITGGGAKNNFLIELLRSKTSAQITVPEENIIDFKEALIFGFLGALYSLKIPNSLASVTGSHEDIIGGVLHTP
ncbi:MAG: anhydro-N-acetylmuramic acid kinase [Crocinitomicaceae bacterium]